MFGTAPGEPFMLDKLQWLEKPVNVDSMRDQSDLPHQTDTRIRLKNS